MDHHEVKRIDASWIHLGGQPILVKGADVARPRDPVVPSEVRYGWNLLAPTQQCRTRHLLGGYVRIPRNRPMDFGRRADETPPHRT